MLSHHKAEICLPESFTAPPGKWYVWLVREWKEAQSSHKVLENLLFRQSVEIVSGSSRLKPTAGTAPVLTEFGGSSDDFDKAH